LFSVVLVSFRRSAELLFLGKGFLMTQHSSPPRSAFTLVELLVVIAIIAVLIGLLLPAIQKVRDSAARLQSANNLKQMGIATHSYNDTEGGMPSGSQSNYTYSGWNGSWYNSSTGSQYGQFVELMPYMEQSGLYQSIVAGTYPTNSPKYLVDPSDKTVGSAGSTPITSYWPGAYIIYNYTYIASPYQYNYRYEPGIWSASSNSTTFVGGAYAQYSSTSTGKKRSMTQVFADGTSNTLLFGEHVSGCSSTGYQSFMYVYGPYQQYTYYDYGGGSTYGPSSSGVTGFKTNMTYATCGNYSASNYMTSRGDVVQICLADTSVRGIDANISQTTTQNLLDPADGQVLGKDF